jgi:hypothetical protein
METELQLNGCQKCIHKELFTAEEKHRNVSLVRLSAWNNSAPTGQIMTKFDI